MLIKLILLIEFPSHVANILQLFKNKVVETNCFLAITIFSLEAYLIHAVLHYNRSTNHPTPRFAQHPGSPNTQVHPTLRFTQHPGLPNTQVLPTPKFTQHPGSPNIQIPPTPRFAQHPGSPNTQVRLVCQIRCNIIFHVAGFCLSNLNFLSKFYTILHGLNKF